MTSPSLENNPRPASWLTIDPAGRILVRSGKVELGQGVLTALAQIVADELDLARPDEDATRRVEGQPAGRPGIVLEAG